MQGAPFLAREKFGDALRKRRPPTKKSEALWSHRTADVSVMVVMSVIAHPAYLQRETRHHSQSPPARARRQDGGSPTSPLSPTSLHAERGCRGDLIAQG
jgi:hypothetical protein